MLRQSCGGENTKYQAKIFSFLKDLGLNAIHEVVPCPR